MDGDIPDSTSSPIQSFAGACSFAQLQLSDPYFRSPQTVSTVNDQKQLRALKDRNDGFTTCQVERPLLNKCAPALCILKTVGCKV